MKNVIIFLIILASTLNALAQNKIIYWVHGLGGDRSTWGQAADATQLDFTRTDLLNNSYQPYKVYSNRLDYSTSNGSLETAGNDVKNFILTADNAYKGHPEYNIDYTKSFSIGHSLGGLVLRKVDQKYDLINPNSKCFHGIVTFATPHAGTALLTPETKQIYVPNYIQSACTELTIGPAEELQNNLVGDAGFLKGLLIDNILNQDKVEKIVNALCSAAAIFLPKFIAPLNLPITNDFYAYPGNTQVASSALTNLNYVTSSLPKVAFYGVEESGSELWRLISSSSTTVPTSNDYFVDPTADGDILDFKNRKMAMYLMKRDLYNNLYHAGGPGNIADRWLKLRNYWGRGVNFWNNANDSWLRIIGANYEIPISTPGFDCNCTQYDYDGFPVSNWSYQVTDPSQCVGQGNSNFTDCSTSPTTIYDFTVVHEPNDGAVTKTSALAFPGIDLNNTQSMINSNHSQLTNDANTRDRLKELFFGYYGKFFMTTNR